MSLRHGQSICICIATFLCYTSCSNPWSVQTYPNPRSNPVDCRRPERKFGFVCDPDGVITEEQGMLNLIVIISIIRGLTFSHVHMLVWEPVAQTSQTHLMFFYAD